jgi:hypothetical protein
MAKSANNVMVLWTMQCLTTGFRVYSVLPQKVSTLKKIYVFNVDKYSQDVQNVRWESAQNVVEE